LKGLRSAGGPSLFLSRRSAILETILTLENRPSILDKRLFVEAVFPPSLGAPEKEVHDLETEKEEFIHNVSPHCSSERKVKHVAAVVEMSQCQVTNHVCDECCAGKEPRCLQPAFWELDVFDSDPQHNCQDTEERSGKLFKLIDDDHGLSPKKGRSFKDHDSTN
jgi:hypothetical protein